jgi:PBP1b-binding outer membrane lipoprotein LpoB
MKKTIIYCLGIIACSFLVGGCATTSETSIVEGPGKLTTHDLDTQDFAAKADDMVASLVESDVLDKAAQHPAVIAVGNIINNTSLYIDTDELMKTIRVALNKNGKAVTDTTGGALNTDDFTFSGKIIQPPNAREGNKTQRTYIFQLSLTDNKGLAVWEDEKEVSKLTTRPGLGL